MEIDSLKRVYLFESLTPQELKYLAGLVRRRDVAQGEVLFKDGQVAVSLFIVEKGSLRVLKSAGPTAPPSVIASIPTGALFGEIPFVAGGNRTAEVVGQEPTTILEISYDELERLTQLNPAFGVKLYKALAAYLARNVAQMTTGILQKKKQ